MIKGPRQRDHPFYRHGSGHRGYDAAFSQSQPEIRAFPFPADFYFKYDRPLRSQHHLSHTGHFPKDQPDAAQTGPHDDFHSHRRNLHPRMHDCPG